MDPACILMCANIPRGIPEDVFIELFCIAGPVEDVSISRSGRSCFVIYEFPEAVSTAKDIFKDVLLYGRRLEMLDQNDIKQIHERQEQESNDLQQQAAAFAEVVQQHNPFYDPDSMTPTNIQGRPPYYPSSHNNFDPSPKKSDKFSHHFNPPANHFSIPPPNHFYGDNYDPSVPTRRWGSTPETNQPQFSPAELDFFKSPYSQPVSRKNYEQNRKNYYDDIASNSNHAANRSRRYFEKSASFDSLAQPSFHKKSRNYNQNTEEGDVYQDNGDEEQTRRQFQESPKKSYRENDRYNHSKYNADSTRSDNSNRHKSHNSFERHSPYPRNDYKRFDHRDSKRSNHYKDREHRNHRR